MFSVLDLFWLELVEISVFAGATVTVVGLIPTGSWTTTLLVGILRSEVDIFVEGIVEGIPVEVGVGTMEVGEGDGFWVLAMSHLSVQRKRLWR